MTYVLIRDCDYGRRSDSVDIIGMSPNIDRLRRIRTFSAEQLTSWSLDGVTLTAVETTDLTQKDDPADTFFSAKIYQS